MESRGFNKVRMKFIVDRMLGRLTTWLRLLGYDAVSASDFDRINGEDDFLLDIAEGERILITRDRTLKSKAERRGIRICFIDSDMVMEQLEEVHSHYNFDLTPRMIRCTICNSLIRRQRVEDEDMLKKEDYVPDRLMDVIDFWVCDNCGQVYWKGSHWEDIYKRLEKLRKRIRES